MPRASWKGFLRLSLVSCPIYLSPATTRKKSIRCTKFGKLPGLMNQTRCRIRLERKMFRNRQPGSPSMTVATRQVTLARQRGLPSGLMIPAPARRLRRRRSSRDTSISAANSSGSARRKLKALDVESSKVIDLEKFVPRGELDPVYFNAPYYVYPDSPIAVEALRVIGTAMAESGVFGIGRLRY